MKTRNLSNYWFPDPMEDLDEIDFSDYDDNDEED